MCGCTRHSNANDVFSLNLITLKWENLKVPTDGNEALSPRDKATCWVHDNRFGIIIVYYDRWQKTNINKSIDVTYGVHLNIK